MKVIIAGSRTISDASLVVDAVIESGFEITHIISGDAPGVDSIGAMLGEVMEIPVLHFPAEWDEYGNSAGIFRNGKMAIEADALVAVWDGKSPGTSNMISRMQRMEKTVYVKVV